jgi:hypothetical protein
MASPPTTRALSWARYRPRSTAVARVALFTVGALASRSNRGRLARSKPTASRLPTNPK